MFEERMKYTPVVIQLTIHQVSLALKFTAQFSLEMQMGNEQKQIWASSDLSNNPLNLNLNTKIQTELIYDIKTKQFLAKQLNIIMFITTKSSPKKLKAGIATITITKSSQHIKHERIKLSKCHDSAAFFEYSLKSRLSTSKKVVPQKSYVYDRGDGRSVRVSHSSDVFKSAVYYKTNPQMSQPQQKSGSNELKRYLRNSLKQPNTLKSQCKHRSSQKNINRDSIWIDDQSKTERRSYGINREQQKSPSSKDQNVVQVKMKDHKSQKLLKQVKNAKMAIEHLMSENKEMKAKLNFINDELEKRETTIRSLKKKIQMKENSHSEQTKILRTKLTDAQNQLKQMMNYKSSALNKMSQKDQELMIIMKEKERQMHENKKQLTMELQQKCNEIKEMKSEVFDLKQLLTESQAIVDHLTESAAKYQQKIDDYSNQVKNYKFELQRAKQQITDLQELLKNKNEKNQQTKAIKRQLQDANRKKEQNQAIIAQKHAVIEELEIEVQKYKSKNAEKQETIISLVRQNKQKSDEIDELLSTQKQLKARIYRIQNDAQQDNAQSVAINKQIRTVQVQLSKVKLQSEYTNATRAKKLQQYQKINELLNKKMELLAQENIELLQKAMTLTDKFNVKDDQHCELARELVGVKEQVVSLEGELDNMKEERDYLQRRVKQLELKEEEVVHLRDQVEHRDKLLEELEHREQLREIELTTQIQLMASKKEQRQQQIERLKEQVIKLQQQTLDYQSQVQDLNYTIKNLQNELLSAHLQTSNYKNNNLHFQQRMLALQRTEVTSLSSIQELHQQNLNYRLMLKQNQDAMTALGIRSDNLFKGIVQVLERFYQLLTQSRNIANQHIKHDKVEIARVLNDSLRKIGEQRAKNQEMVNNLETELLEQRAKNSQASKIIKIKTQILQQLQQDITNHKNHQQNLNSKISTLQNQIKRYQNELKDKMSEVRELKLQMEGLKKQHRDELGKKDDVIKGHLREINKLNDQVSMEKNNLMKSQELFKKKLEIQQEQTQNKLDEANIKYNQLEATLKTEKQAHRLLKSKFAQQQLQFSKMSKQKDSLTAEMQKRTKDLISVRAESQFRYKMVCQKQTQISQLKLTIDQLQKQKESIETKRKNLEQGNKALVITRGQLQTSVRDKNREISELQSKVAQLQQTKVRLSKNKQDLLYTKKNQETTIRDLNQNCKVLKDSLLLSEQNVNKAKIEKQQLEKEWTKKMNLANKESQNLQKQLEGLKTKSKELVIESREKSAELVVELSETKKQNQQYEEQIANLKKQLTISTAKIHTLTHQLANKSPNNNKFLQPGKEKELADLVSQLTAITKQAQPNSKKLPIIAKGSPIDKNLPRLGQLSRDVSTAANKLKIFILNRSNLPSEQKLPIIQEVRNVQGAVDKLCKQCLL